MDPLIASYPAQSLNEDLNICPGHGVAYQKRMDESVTYGPDYYAKYVAYKGSEIALRINKVRTELTNRLCRCLLDIGIGSGEFIQSSTVRVLGYDVNPLAISWLQERGLYCDPYEGIPPEVDGVTMWDSLEHITSPSLLLGRFRPGTRAFLSLPIIDDLRKVTGHKHYKPNEHYYYFTKEGLIKYFQDLQYHLVEANRDESDSGREFIGTFHFLKG